MTNVAEIFTAQESPTSGLSQDSQTSSAENLNFFAYGFAHEGVLEPAPAMPIPWEDYPYVIYCD